MHAWIQTMVDVLIIVMAAILVIFTLGLIVLHIITTSNSKRVEQIKRRIMRMLSVTQDLEFLRGQIHQLLEPGGEIRSLRQIHGIKSNRGAIAMTFVVDEISKQQRDRLRALILRDEWYMGHIRKKLRARNSDWVGVFTKLTAELQLSVLDEDVLANIYRWPKKADNQEISLLALFMCGSRDKLVALFSDSAFQLILSFRALQELFTCYAGDHEELCRLLIGKSSDSYITRACIREIGSGEMAELAPMVIPFLKSENVNVLIDSIRTLGKLHCMGVTEEIRQYTRHIQWSVRSTAVTALAEMAPENCYEDLLRCLCDPEWWVRFHAAEALYRLPGHPDLMADVQALGDRFAFEMMRYICRRNELLYQEVSV